MDSKDCRAQLTYLQWQELYKTERPYDIASAYYHGDIPKTNVVLLKSSEEELVHNVRGQEKDFELDKHGFAFCRLEGNEASLKNFHDRDAVENFFIPEIVEPLLTKHVESAERIFVFDWHVSRSKRSSRLSFFDEM